MTPIAGPNIAELLPSWDRGIVRNLGFDPIADGWRVMYATDARPGERRITWDGFLSGAAMNATFGHDDALMVVVHRLLSEMRRNAMVEQKHYRRRVDPVWGWGIA